MNLDQDEKPVADGGIVTQEMPEGMRLADERGPPAPVAVPRHAMQTAIMLAEKAVSGVSEDLRRAELDRDDLARKLGCMQERIDKLVSRRDRQSRHVSDLQFAMVAGAKTPPGT